ncbi:MAG: hypothetical protein NTY65_03680, partial [Planctomycetota bacterium]|nr:hypothetical protein [Planctomycetota bacterium]
MPLTNGGGVGTNDRKSGPAGADADANHTLEETLYYCQDANWNVTAVMSAAGSVVERYVYDPYGKATVLEADWSADRDRTYIDGSNLYQFCLSRPACGTDPMGLCFGTAPYVDQYEARGPEGDTGVTGATGPEVDGSVPGGLVMRAPTGFETPIGPEDPSLVPAWLRELDSWTAMFTPGPLQATNLLHQVVATEGAAREFSNYLQEAKEETGASSLWTAAPGAAFNFGVDTVIGAIPGVSFLKAASNDQKHYDGAYASGPNYTETTDLERVMLIAKGAVEMVAACLGAKFLGPEAA